MMTRGVSKIHDFKLKISQNTLLEKKFPGLESFQKPSEILLDLQNWIL